MPERGFRWGFTRGDVLAHGIALVALVIGVIVWWVTA